MGLVDIGYRFGGKNPEAGFDCSGLVAYIYWNAVHIALSGSASELAHKGTPIDRAALKAGDLVFFNTLHRRHSHVGIYVGNGRFVHAPSSAERVRIDSLSNPYFAARFEEARSYLEG